MINNDLQESLLAEHTQQQNTSLQPSSQRIHDLSFKDNVKRYQDIFCEHAASQNMSRLTQASYKSTDASTNQSSAFEAVEPVWRPQTDIDHIEREVRRETLVHLFLDKIQADEYMAKHLYGLREVESDPNINQSVQDLTFEYFEGRTDENRQVKRLSEWETYITLIKGYCGVSLLFFPKAFQNGGYIFSGVVESICAVLTTVCVIKLIKCGLHYNIFSYSSVVERAFGRRARDFIELLIAATQFSFLISQVVFMLGTLTTTFNQDTTLWMAGFLLVVLTLIAWVRDIGKFSFTFLIGNLIMLATIFVVIVFCAKQISTQGGLGPNLGAMNGNYPLMISFAVYSYEGIGVVMPIMQITEKPEKFTTILIAAMATLVTCQITFGTLAYLTYGSDMEAQIITEMLPGDNGVVITVKLAYVLCILASYAITAAPCFTIGEGWLKLQRTSNLKTLTFRFLLVVASVALATTVADKLDKFLGLLGALLCAPIALTIPALLHMKVLAKTPSERFFDFAVVVLSLGALLFCVTQTLQNW